MDKKKDEKIVLMPDGTKKIFCVKCKKYVDECEISIDKKRNAYYSYCKKCNAEARRAEYWMKRGIDSNLICKRQRKDKSIIKDGIEYLRCSLCGEYKPKTIEYFNRNSKSIHGFQGHCKKCHRDSYKKKFDNIKDKLVILYDEIELYNFKKTKAIQKYLEKNKILRVPHGVEIKVESMEVTEDDLLFLQKKYCN